MSEYLRSPIPLDDPNDFASRLDFPWFPLGLIVHIHLLILGSLLLLLGRSIPILIIGIIVA